MFSTTKRKQTKCVGFSQREGNKLKMVFWHVFSNNKKKKKVKTVFCHVFSNNKVIQGRLTRELKQHIREDQAGNPAATTYYV